MKKALFITVGILVGTFVVLSVLGLKGDYVAEKQLWKINQRYVSVVKDAQSVPDAAFNRLIDDYKRFLSVHGKSQLAPIGHMFLGRVYVAKKDYPTAQKVFEEIIAKYQKLPAIGAQAAAEIAQVYTAQKDDANVLATYKRILRDYPVTDIGMRMPLVIAKYYVDKNEVGSAKESFDKAVVHYKKLISDYPRSAVEFNSLRLIATCYVSQRRWEEAIAILGEVLIKFPTMPYLSAARADSMLRTINTISVGQLKDFDRPVAIYREFMNKYPQHPLNKLLSTMISGLGEMKKQSLEATAETKK